MAENSQKSVHTIVLDAGPILKNVPPLDTLLARAEELVTTPSVINEIRDPDARSRVETLYLPFVKQRTPSAKSIAVISEFARKTGDRAVLSKVDLEVLALAYEIECERNGGDWRLRSVPGQKRLNGKPPGKEDGEKKEDKKEDENNELNAAAHAVDQVAESLKKTNIDDTSEKDGNVTVEQDAPTQEAVEGPQAEEVQQGDNEDEEDGADTDGEGEWITPSNIKKRQALDEAGTAAAVPEPAVMQVATMTTDFAVGSQIRMIAKIMLTRTVSKCSSADESKPAFSDDTTANPSLKDFYQALPCLLYDDQRPQPTVLSKVWKGFVDPGHMHHGCQRSIQAAPQEEHAVEQPRKPIQHPQAGPWDSQREMGWARWRKRWMGERPHPR